MSEQYLWDASGEPDPEVRKLEQLLARFCTPARPAGEWLFTQAEQPSVFSRALRWRVLLAGALVVAFAAAIVWWLPTPRPIPPATLETAWQATRLDKRTSSIKPILVRRGAWLATDNVSSLKISQAEVGEVELAPNSRLAILQSDATSERFALTFGQIHAVIWAPPGRFMVDTPSAEAVDLGCEYKLQVDDDGRGLLSVSFGWVAFRSNGRESFVPAGAFCKTRPGSGPDTPYFGDASSELRQALDTLDNALDSGSSDPGALSEVIAKARRRDAFTLWHLLARVPEAQRRQVYMRLASLVPPPAGVTAQTGLRLDRAALDRWWNALGLDDISIWRSFERPWPARTPH